MRFKLITLGAVSLAVLILIGVISMVMLTNSNRNYEMANNMNEVSRLAEQNETLMVQYISTKDIQFVNEMLTNTEKSYDIINSNRPNANYRKQWNELNSLLEQNASNMQEITELTTERGFDGSSGMYQKISENDTQLHEQLNILSDNASWIDISMISTGNFLEGSTEVNGATYQQFRYVNTIPDVRNRNTLAVRLGGERVEYKGTAYITGVTLSNDTSEVNIDLEKTSDFVLNNSYGSALTGVAYMEFAG